jgi:hypothetical protein
LTHDPPVEPLVICAELHILASGGVSQSIKVGLREVAGLRDRCLVSWGLIVPSSSLGTHLNDPKVLNVGVIENVNLVHVAIHHDLREETQGMVRAVRLVRLGRGVLGSS